MSNSTFRDLHRDFLLLPNAWDPGTARVVESLGAKAIATTSAGMAWSRGFPDGDALRWRNCSRFAFPNDIAKTGRPAAERRIRNRTGRLRPVRTARN